MLCNSSSSFYSESICVYLTIRYEFECAVCESVWFYAIVIFIIGLLFLFEVIKIIENTDFG